MSIEVQNISKFFGSRQVLFDLNFKVETHTVHGFLGPNGAGKSTTMKIMAGLLRPSSGDMRIHGLSVVERPEQTKKMLGLLPEICPLYPEMRVEDYLLFVAELHGLDRQRRKKSVEVTMEKMGLTSMAKRLVGNLSKGNKQKVGMAQALVFNPPLLILDEPTSGLDPEATVQMRELLRELKNEHTIILSSHLLHEVALACDSITIIAEGRIVASDSMEKILAKHEVAPKVKREEENLEAFFLKAIKKPSMGHEVQL